MRLQWGRTQSPSAVHVLAELLAAELHGPSAGAGRHQRAAGVPPLAAHSVPLEPACQYALLQPGLFWHDMTTSLLAPVRSDEAALASTACALSP